MKPFNSTQRLYLQYLALVEFTLFRQLSQLTHIRKEQLGNTIARHRIPCLRLERIANSCDDTCSICCWLGG